MSDRHRVRFAVESIQAEAPVVAGPRAFGAEAASEVLAHQAARGGEQLLLERLRGGLGFFLGKIHDGISQVDASSRDRLSGLGIPHDPLEFPRLGQGEGELGLITGSQTPDPTMMIGATTIRSYGFPWTTGQVYVHNTDSNGPRPATTTFTATGSDMRGPDGQGVITLVAGGISHQLRRAEEFSSLDIVRLTIGNVPETPASSPAGLAAGAALMLLAVAYARRRRF